MVNSLKIVVNGWRTEEMFSPIVHNVKREDTPPSLGWEIVLNVLLGNITQNLDRTNALIKVRRVQTHNKK